MITDEFMTFSFNFIYEKAKNLSLLINKLNNQGKFFMYIYYLINDFLYIVFL
jgi:hypothetical protein